jgi:hypothetical protein
MIRTYLVLFSVFVLLLFLEDSKADKKMLVVLIHGKSSSKDTWGGFMKEFPAQENVDLVAVDLFGHGRKTNEFQDGATFAADLLGDLKAFIEQERKGRKVILVGHSMGGRIVMDVVASSAPGYVDGVVIEDMDTRDRGAEKRDLSKEKNTFQCKMSEPDAIAFLEGFGYSKEWFELKVKQGMFWKTDDDLFWMGSNPFATYFAHSNFLQGIVFCFSFFFLKHVFVCSRFRSTAV